MRAMGGVRPLLVLAVLLVAALAADLTHTSKSEDELYYRQQGLGQGGQVEDAAVDAEASANPSGPSDPITASDPSLLRSVGGAGGYNSNSAQGAYQPGGYQSAYQSAGYQPGIANYQTSASGPDSAAGVPTPAHDQLDFKYHNYEKMTKYLRTTSSRHPKLTALYSIGKSVQDHLKRYRLLKFLKSNKSNPQTVSTSESCVQLGHGSHQPSSTSAVTAVRRAQGKTGASWKGNTPTVLLQVSLPYRKWLRWKPMPEEYLQRISDDLWNGHQLDISWEQIREKFRSLKRQFGQAKKGELGGQNWEHYWLMVYIFDEDLASSNMTLCPEGFNLHDQDQPVPNEAASVPLQLSPAVTEAAQSVPIIGAAAPSQEVALTKAATVNSGSNLIRQVSASDSGQCESVLLSALDWDNLLQSGSALCASPVLKPQQGILPDKSLGDNGNLSDLEMHDILALDDGILPPDFSSTLMTTERATPSITNNLLVRSPAPKKNKRPTYIIPPRSPAKQRTPKRKQSKSSLQWDSEETTAFVQLCVLNKERLVVSNISNTTWKDLATGLQLFNVEKSWQLCRDKFQQMYSFFEGTLLPCGGILGSRKWTHYEDFCQLFDIPEDYHVVMSSANEAADSTVAASSSQGGRLWTKERVLSLISSYKDRAAHFLGSKSVMRHNVLWAQISKEVSAAANEAISWKQCRDHMSVLKQKMHDEHLKIRNTGQSPSKWEYLDAMLDIFGGTASISAPFSFGAGTAESYRARDEEVREKPRSTRTREPDPNVSNSKKGTGAQRKLVFKNRVQELQEIQVEQKDKLLSEVQRLRLIMEDTKEERSKLFSNINRRLEDIGKSFQSTKP